MAGTPRYRGWDVRCCSAALGTVRSTRVPVTSFPASHDSSPDPSHTRQRFLAAATRTEAASSCSQRQPARAPFPAWPYQSGFLARRVEFSSGGRGFSQVYKSSHLIDDPRRREVALPMALRSRKGHRFGAASRPWRPGPCADWFCFRIARGRPPAPLADSARIPPPGDATSNEGIADRDSLKTEPALCRRGGCAHRPSNLQVKDSVDAKNGIHGQFARMGHVRRDTKLA